MAKAVDAAFVAKPVTQEGLREFLVNAAEVLTNEST
jgi:hypothetical protein